MQPESRQNAIVIGIIVSLLLVITGGYMWATIEDDAPVSGPGDMARSTPEVPRPPTPFVPQQFQTRPKPREEKRDAFPASNQGSSSGESATWKAEEVAAWVEPLLLVNVGQPMPLSWGGAGNNKVLLVRIVIRSPKSHPNAVSQWRELATELVPKERVPRIADGSYALLDTNRILLDTGTGTARQSSFALTPAEMNVIRSRDTQTVQVGEAPAREGWRGTLHAMGRLIGLVEPNKLVDLTLVYEVPKGTSIDKAKMLFFYQTVQLTQGASLKIPPPNGAAWHSEIWHKTE